MDRNRNQEHISIRADASEPLKAIHRKGGRDTIFPVSIRADASELLEDKRQEPTTTSGCVSIRADASELLEVLTPLSRAQVTYCCFNSR